MRGYVAVGVLAMLECGTCLFVYVLIEFAAEGCCHHLYAAADAQDRYLAIGSEAHQHQFLPVACRVYRAQLRYRFLTQV